MTTPIDKDGTPPVDPAVAEAAKAAVVAAVVDAVTNTPSGVPADLLTKEEWEHLSRRDKRLLRGIFERIAHRETLARDLDAELGEARTFGQRVADGIARFGGSWPFILLFLGFLATWIAFNTIMFRNGEAPDPYPYILLNLMLSMIAALQAPIIMMSQNRQAMRDRAAAENDYAVNLRAEVEIRELHNKLDELREGQWVQLIAQQQEQIRLLETLCGPTLAPDDAQSGDRTETT
jgi:uncharacterized membrane protein